MVLFFELLFLLWFINFAPVAIAQVLERKWDIPLDSGFRLIDGQPLFGSHKTIRGCLAGVAAGTIAGVAMGFPLWLAVGAGVLSMSGDLFSSFLKRRLWFHSGDVVPGLDQIPEGLLPFLLIAPHFSLSLGYVLLCVTVFSVGAYYGSVFFNQVLLKKPYAAYPRKVCPTTRIRELISCQITTTPLRYLLNFEDAVYYHIFMKTVFQACRLYDRGRRNALVVETREVTFEFSDLPPAFDGYRVLLLTDLHLDGLDGLTERLVELVRPISADLCILGGDFRMHTHGPFANALSHLLVVLPQIRARDGIVAVLGNHDCIEIVDRLQEEGIRFLVNESTAIEREGQKLWLVGVDDAHYFRCHDPEHAYKDVPKEAFSIFISHSNEVYREASEYKPDLYLCGHTHAGQIRIPPFGPIFTHSSAPRSMCAGRWSYKGMPGYTSAGVGVSGVPVRFNSTGEVTVITLRKKVEEGK